MPASSPASDSPLPRIEREALDWFVRGQGGLDAQETQAFHTWLRADAAHAAAHARWAQDWQGLDALPPAAVDRLRRGLGRDQQLVRARSPNARGGRQMAMPWQRTALAATALTVSVAGFFAWDHWRQQPIYAQTFVTARGQQSDITLPDGSKLRLDTATRAEVRLYHQRREVRLPEGQAMFEVRGDPLRPFDVLAGPLRMTVVGTRFSVRYTPSLSADEPAQVAVEQGYVRVRASGGSAPDAPGSAAAVPVELVAGQQVSSDAAGVLGPVAAVSTGGIAAWRQYRVSFDNLPLARALAELERYGDTHFVLADPALGALRLTGTFDPRRLDNFSRLLPQALPVRLRTANGQTEIVAAPPG